MKIRSFMQWRACFGVVLLLAAAMPGAAEAQASRDTALAALRGAAEAGNVDAELALANLLDNEPTQRDDEALRWYRAAAHGGSAIARERVLAMMARRVPKESATPKSFFVQVPRSGRDIDQMPPDVPPGYHCHDLGSGRFWCHGGADAKR